MRPIARVNIDVGARARRRRGARPTRSDGDNLKTGQATGGVGRTSPLAQRNRSLRDEPTKKRIRAAAIHSASLVGDGAKPPV